jgi:hypothetical protein
MKGDRSDLLHAAQSQLSRSHLPHFVIIKCAHKENVARGFGSGMNQPGVLVLAWDHIELRVGWMSFLHQVVRYMGYLKENAGRTVSSKTPVA